RLGPPGKSQQEEGLLMVRARSAERLAALVERVNGIVKESGELKAVEPCEHDGFKYFRRVERRETNFYCLRGPVLIFSGQEGMLRRALAGERKLPADEESPVGKQLRLLGAHRALAAVWVNPRSYDDILADKLRQAEG